MCLYRRKDQVLYRDKFRNSTTREHIVQKTLTFAKLLRLYFNYTGTHKKFTTNFRARFENFFCQFSIICPNFSFLALFFLQLQLYLYLFSVFFVNTLTRTLILRIFFLQKISHSVFASKIYSSFLQHFITVLFKSVIFFRLYTFLIFFLNYKIYTLFDNSRNFSIKIKV